MTYVRRGRRAQRRGGEGGRQRRQSTRGGRQGTRDRRRRPGCRKWPPPSVITKNTAGAPSALEGARCSKTTHSLPDYISIGGIRRHETCSGRNLSTPRSASTRCTTSICRAAGASCPTPLGLQPGAPRKRGPLLAATSPPNSSSAKSLLEQYKLWKQRQAAADGCLTISRLRRSNGQGRPTASTLQSGIAAPVATSAASAAQKSHGGHAELPGWARQFGVAAMIVLLRRRRERSLRWRLRHENPRRLSKSRYLAEEQGRLRLRRQAMAPSFGPTKPSRPKAGARGSAFYATRSLTRDQLASIYDRLCIEDAQR